MVVATTAISSTNRSSITCLRRARNSANGTPSVNRDLKRIEEYVKGGFDRSRTRGLAIFSCSAHDLWQVVALPKPVRNQLVINEVPAVGQLEAAVEESVRFGVLLVDKQRARMFVFEMDELVELSERFDELPRDYDQRGERDQGDTSNHVDALTGQHVKPRRRSRVRRVPGAALRAPLRRRAR